MNQVAVVDHYH